MTKKIAPATLDTAFFSAGDIQSQAVYIAPSQPISPALAIMATTYCLLLAAPPTRIDLL